MRGQNARLIILVMGLWLMSFGLFAQTAQEKVALLRQIDITNGLLSEIESRKGLTLSHLRILNKQIGLRKTLIKGLRTQSDSLSEVLNAQESAICGLNNELERITENLHRALRVAHYNAGQSASLLAIISAGNLEEAYARFWFYRSFIRHREQQLTLIAQQRDKIAAYQAQAAQTLEKKLALMKETREEVASLTQVREKQSQVFEQLSRQATQFRRTLRQQRRTLKALIAQIETVARNDLRGRDPGPEADFQERMGMLPWPVSRNRCVIITPFGRSKDPFGNLIQEDGIQIATPIGEAVKVIHPGVVTGVQEVPLHGYMVVVAHGPYRAVYANLGRPQVRRGDEVTEGQQIGLVRVDPRTNESTFTFMLYEEPDTFLDPELWMRLPAGYKQQLVPLATRN